MVRREDWAMCTEMCSCESVYVFEVLGSTCRNTTVYVSG